MDMPAPVRKNGRPAPIAVILETQPDSATNPNSPTAAQLPPMGRLDRSPSDESLGGTDEPLLAENPNRFTMFPIEHPDVWELYKKAMASFWTAQEVDLADDVKHWQRLTDDERHFISHVLAFFAASDGIVNENLGARFMREVQWPEARAMRSEGLMPSPDARASRRHARFTGSRSPLRTSTLVRQ